MKTNQLIAVSIVSSFCLLSSAFGQGALTPPGPPAPTMLTLNQMEPRTPISSAPYSITKPGSYYLTTNLTVNVNDAIDINTNGVTLDLNGFTISSTSPFDSGTAILLNVVNYNNNTGPSDIIICNGHITGGVTNKSGVYGGPGFNNGISYFLAPPAPPSNIRVTGITVSGCLTYGINVGNGNSPVVESCIVNTVGGSGIVASSVSHSTAVQCGSSAISADTASDCYGSCTGSGDGLDAFTANNCHGTSVSGFGLSVNDANNCYGTSSSGTGLSAIIAIGCTGNSVNAAGISADIANSCLSSSGDGSISHAYNMP